MRRHLNRLANVAIALGPLLIISMFAFVITNTLKHQPSQQVAPPIGATQIVTPMQAIGLVPTLFMKGTPKVSCPRLNIESMGLKAVSTYWDPDEQVSVLECKSYNDSILNLSDRHLVELKAHISRQSARS